MQIKQSFLISNRRNRFQRIIRFHCHKHFGCLLNLFTFDLKCMHIHLHLDYHDLIFHINNLTCISYTTTNRDRCYKLNIKNMEYPDLDSLGMLITNQITKFYDFFHNMTTECKTMEILILKLNQRVLL